MGKFDGILICSDLDDTLLTSERAISDENKNVIEYFMAEGGKFTFCTGRVPHGAKIALQYIVPNVPMICFNGAAIYDFENDRLLWEMFLDDEAARVVEYVEERMPQIGVEVCTNFGAYHCRSNRLTREHVMIERLPEISIEHNEIKDRWKKVIFMAELEDMPELKRLLGESQFAEKYTFIQSYKHYYELLPKGVGKGEAMLVLAKMLGIDRKKTVGVGDNENDISLVSLAGAGVSVSNAIKEVRDVADYITVDNDNHALAVIIEAIENGKIVFKHKQSY
ncbi:MAG: Cof-type HAD-IIB family hydrolase [Clostridia bacterium]|nr:Cof-type HAD-IIB family hydrolase [Clostridia bacterium]